jgi:hypothetical protein
MKVMTLATTALLATAAPAAAQMRTTATYGAWSTAEGVSTGGEPMCSASLLGADRSLFVKTGGELVYFHVFKDGWRIPVDQRVDVVMQVDNAPPISLIGYGLPEYGPNVPGGFDIEIHPDDIWEHSGRTLISEVVDLLKNGRNLRLSFPDGDEPPWEGSLSGSARALTAMISCRNRLLARLTQPFGTKKVAPASALGPAPAQPFGNLPPALPSSVDRELSLGAHDAAKK